MTKIKDIIAHLEGIAPTALQESYDNAGLITGNPNTPVQGVLVSLDCTEPIIEEAISKGCNLVIAHHPIIFKGLKKLTGRNYVERTVIKAIKHDVAIYAIHTNLDNIHTGVNHKIAQKIGLQQCRILQPKKQVLSKLVTYIPTEATAQVMAAIHAAGAGTIGNYSHCSFQVSGTGTFKPNEAANPHIGQANQLEQVTENRVEVEFDSHNQRAVLAALHAAHPYEAVAYDVYQLENTNPTIGAGMVGLLPQPMDEMAFLHHLKQAMQLNTIKHTHLTGRPVQRVALCGGAGGFLLPNAIAQKADVFITADMKYHEYFDADGHLVIADIGHYESEVYTKELIKDILLEKFSNFVPNLAEYNSNPIKYL